MSNDQKSKKLLFWGAADIGEGFISTVTNTYFSMFLTDVAMLPIGLSGLVMTLTSVFDFIAAPLAGGIVSGTKPGKFGRLRTWLTWAPLVVIIAFVICFLPLNNPILATITITLFFCIAKGFYNLTWVANLSLINVLSDTPETRTKLTSQRQIGFYIGRLAAGYITPYLASAFALWVGERFSYAPVMAVAGILLYLGHLVHFKLSKGYEKSEDDTSTVGLDEGENVSLKEMFKALATNAQLLITVIVDLTSNMQSFLLPALATYYYKYVAQDTDLMALHMLLTGFGGLIGSLVVRSLGKKIKDHRNFLCVAYLLIAVFLFSCRFVAYMPVWFMILNIIAQSITGTTQPLEIQLYMDNVVYHEYKTGVNANAFIMSMCNMPVKFATILKSIIIPFVLAQAGYVAGGAITPKLQQGIINAYTIVPTIIPIIGFILLRFFYKLSKDEVFRMKEEIAKRTKEENQ